VESLIGTTIGGYTITQELGSGVTGQTFAAAHKTGAVVALKLVHPTLSLFTRVEAYWSELQRLGELSHRHIVVPTTADWSKSGRFHMAMDLLAGLDLHQALAQHGRLPASQALLIAGQVLSALEAAHREGYVHGAVKPHNIFLVPRDTEPSGISARMLDFATSCLVTAAALPSGLPGSPGVPEAAYLAPEQFGGPATPSSDLYSLGVVLYETLTGRRPFVGSADQLATLHASETPERPANLPAGLSDVIMTALGKSPAARFSDAAEMRQALEFWAAQAPAELEVPPLALFTKKPQGIGVGLEELEGDETVRVSLDELSWTLEDDRADRFLEDRREVILEDPRVAEVRTVTEEKQPMAETKSAREGVPEDKELAALAEKAAAPLTAQKEVSRAAAASSQASTTPAAAQPPKEVEAYFDEDEDLVELPLEKSVRAFVATLSPIAPPSKTGRASGNGESLDGALDLFVQEAKAWSAALPPPAVDDERLAQLAKVPAPAPEPEPERQPPLPPALSPQATAEMLPPRRSILLPSIIAFAFGGLFFFGAYKILINKPAAPVSPEPPGSTISAPQTPQTPQPGAATKAAAPDAAPSAAAPAPDSAAPGRTPDAAAAAAAAEPDAAPSSVASGAPDAAPAAPVAAKKATAKTKRARKKAAAAKTVPQAKRPSEPKPKAKKGSKGSDWVDPFSQ
jgi:serine/threonine protein kinase